MDVPESVVTCRNLIGGEWHAPGGPYQDRGPMLATVEKMLQDLGSGYRFVTVPELMKLGRPVRWHWYQRSRLDWLKQVR